MIGIQLKETIRIKDKIKNKIVFKIYKLNSVKYGK